jgi:hypothetical protein
MHLIVNTVVTFGVIRISFGLSGILLGKLISVAKIVLYISAFCPKALKSAQKSLKATKNVHFLVTYSHSNGSPNSSTIIFTCFGV